jgi:hypothetical protein
MRRGRRPDDTLLPGKFTGIDGVKPAGVLSRNGLAISFVVGAVITSVAFVAVQRIRVQSVPNELLAGLPPIEFPPHISRVWINVGSNVDPLTPPDNQTAVVAVEPIPTTAVKIPPHPNIYVVCAAISEKSGFAKLSIYNSGVSASLGVAANKNVYWATEAFRGALPPFIIVPVLTLDQLLFAIPPEIPIDFVMTDMQSYDLIAAKSASLQSLRRIRKYKAEVYW